MCGEILFLLNYKIYLCLRIPNKKSLEKSGFKINMTWRIRLAHLEGLPVRHKFLSLLFGLVGEWNTSNALALVKSLIFSSVSGDSIPMR